MFHPSSGLIALQESLKSAASWCTELLGWGSIERQEAYENLKAWLGAVEEVTGHATQADVALLLQLRNVFKVSNCA